MRLISSILAFVMMFNWTSIALAFPGMSKTTEIRDAGGIFTAWQAPDLSAFRSTFTAPNGITFSVAAAHERITMGFGQKRLVAQRRHDGGLNVITFDGHKTSANEISADLLQQARRDSASKAFADSLDKATLAALSSEEAAAYDAMLAFFQRHDEIAAIGGIASLSARCILNLAAFYVITAAAIIVCIESVGLLCAGAIAGAYQSLDAAIAACDAEQQ